jgi:hypothetical protein
MDMVRLLYDESWNVPGPESDGETDVLREKRRNNTTNLTVAARLKGNPVSLQVVCRYGENLLVTHGLGGRIRQTDELPHHLR